MPHFIKTVLVTGGDLLIVGGADENGMPVKSNLLFQCSTGVLLAKEPLLHSKNPAMGLVHIFNYGA
jgi:ribosomal protein S6E (S10)